MSEGGFVSSPANSRTGNDSDSYSDEDLHDDEETGLTKKEKRRKQKKRKRNAMLDQRIAREKKLSPDEQKEVDRSLIRRLMVNVGLILLWYAFSLAISLVSNPLL